MMRKRVGLKCVERLYYRGKQRRSIYHTIIPNNCYNINSTPLTLLHGGIALQRGGLLQGAQMLLVDLFLGEQRFHGYGFGGGSAVMHAAAVDAGRNAVAHVLGRLLPAQSHLKYAGWYAVISRDMDIWMGFKAR